MEPLVPSPRPDPEAAQALVILIGSALQTTHTHAVHNVQDNNVYEP